jgi:hypothetical protein
LFRTVEFKIDNGTTRVDRIDDPIFEVTGENEGAV